MDQIDLVSKGKRRWKMQYELYIDVFFLINAIMDWMLLKITGKILSCKVGKMRILW